MTFDTHTMANTMPFRMPTGPARAVHGSMPLSLPLWGFLGLPSRIYGGSYLNCPDDMYLVKMAEEIDLYCDQDVPTMDFGVPDPVVLKKAMWGTVKALWRKERVFVGCMGGTGRTGLFMAAMAKLAGEEDPVRHVRKHYKPRAIETRGQEEFIRRLNLLPLRRKMHLLSFYPCMMRS